MKAVNEDELLKLGDVERTLAPYFAEGSKPSRKLIIGLFEEGVLDGVQLGKGRNYWIYRSSLNELINNLKRRVYSEIS
ncbi:MAG: hypothetical protein ACK5NT_06530 [Pyrinomonadaceae bacterium]